MNPFKDNSDDNIEPDEKTTNGIDRETLNKLDPINPEFFDAIKKVNPSPCPFDDKSN